MIDLDLIAEAYGIRFHGPLEPLSGGLDVDASTYRIAGEDGDDYFLKHRTTPDRGASFALDLARNGVKEVVGPIPTTAGEATLRTPDGWILLYPFVTGINAADRLPTRSQWRQLGSALARIHETPADLPHETFRVEGIDRFREAMCRLTREEPKDEIERELSQAMIEKRQEIEICLEMVQHFGTSCATRPADLVPCHSDFHAYNLLVEGRERIWIVDWDHPRLAPRECDLMFILDGGIFGAHGPDEEHAFFEGYGAFTPDPDLLAYYRLARIVEDLVSFTDDVLNPALGLDARTEAVRYFRMALHPNGLAGKRPPLG